MQNLTNAEIMETLRGHPYEQTFFDAYIELGRRAPDSLPELIQAFRKPGILRRVGKAGRFREGLFRAFLIAGPTAGPLLEEAAREKSSVRSEALMVIDALAHACDAESAPMLLDEFRKGDITAARLLARSEAEHQNEIIAALEKNAREDKGKAASIAALGEISSERSREVLKRLLCSQARDDQVFGGLALACHGSAANPMLMELLRREQTAHAALYAVCRMKAPDEELLAAVSGCYEDFEGSLRSAVLHTLYLQAPGHLLCRELNWNEEGKHGTVFEPVSDQDEYDVLASFLEHDGFPRYAPTIIQPYFTIDDILVEDFSGGMENTVNRLRSATPEVRAAMLHANAYPSYYLERFHSRVPVACAFSPASGASFPGYEKAARYFPERRFGSLYFSRVGFNDNRDSAAFQVWFLGDRHPADQVVLMENVDNRWRPAEIRWRFHW